MDELPSRLTAFLAGAAERLREAGLPKVLPEAMERLSSQVDQPCVVAVVGRMKAGKSTFLNALLGEDLAKVGAAETTATINYFRYGQPKPDKPVRCHWSNGTVTDEDHNFLDGLQGNDVETLRRAGGIKHLEYHLLNPYLERITLVDTPGTCAVVDEHVQRTAEFLALARQLRERHNAETERLGGEADAVIYLVGQVARITDQAFLDEFQNVTGGRSRALNALGVLAKIDLHPEILDRRQELADKIATQLKTSLNTVVPISAGMQRAVDRLHQGGPAGIADFMGALQRIPSHRLDKLLADEEFFRELEMEDCPVTPAERAQLLGDIPWAVFTTLARTAAASAFEPEAAEAQWRALAGFDQLRELLDRHFVRRAQFLRCYRIANDARNLLNEVRFKHLLAQRKLDREQQAKLDRFLGFVQSVRGAPGVAKELEDFLLQQSSFRGNSEHLEATWKELDRRLAEFIHVLEELNADFEALQLLDDHAPSFSADELDELRSLFGLYGLDTDRRVQGRFHIIHLAARQQHWLRVSAQESSGYRREAAERAVVAYGNIAAALEPGT